MKRLLILLTIMIFIGTPLASIAQNANDIVPREIEGVAHNMSKQDKIKTQKTKTSQEEVWLKSLLTATPQEGRELAIKMARKTIAAIQTDPEVRKRLRKEYAEDTKQLINTASVVALEFQTIAAANNYWK